MQIKIHKRFLQELALLPLKDRQKIEKFVFEQSSSFRSLHEIKGLSKLRGYHNYFRLRFGNYRVGIRFENNTLTFERVLHRKDLYKYYP